MPHSPFTDQTLVRGHLYAGADRIDQRSSALYAAKTSGADAAATIARLAQTGSPLPAMAVDVGGGTGAIARHLARRLTLRRLVVLDQSRALLGAARRRLAETPNASAGICGDFHQLPLPTGAVDLIIAAFCLYHSPSPEKAIVEIARCLTPTGIAVVATKSPDSYREIDQLIADSNLDAGACERPGLYDSFNSHNAAGIVTTGMRIHRELHQEHTFRFDDFDHLATYVATSPKYHLPAGLRDPVRLAEELRHRLTERPLATTSTVTFITGAKP